MAPLPLGFHRCCLGTVFLLIGIIMTPVLADVSIGTIIETTGMVRDKFSGSYSYQDYNGSLASGLYNDLQMTNGGSLSLQKQMQMKNTDDNSAQDITSQKILQYSSGTSGSHLMAFEHIRTGTVVANCSEGAGSCNDLSCQQAQVKRVDPSASFTILNAQELKATTTSRYSDEELRYSLTIGSPVADSTTPGLNGSLHTTFRHTSAGDGKEVELYDRTMISGLIQVFNRIYQGGDRILLDGLSASEGPFIDKTTMESRYNVNQTGTVGSIEGTAVYVSDIITDGGHIEEARQMVISDEVTTTRVITYESDGGSSVQASELALATQMKDTEGSDTAATCVFSQADDLKRNESPYSQAIAQTGFSGATSAQMSSTSHIGYPADSEGLKLDYRADISIPIGFNLTMAENMQDINKDGTFEDINGNGRLDMHDLVLLFKNFNWLKESDLSSKIDYNNNGRADFADITTLFERIKNQEGKGLKS